jgi:predicted MPP superfamily phosphohydrolase
VRRIPPGSFDLILSGHLHAGQICLPLPGRRITLAHPRARLVAGVYETPAGVMHVSPGTGTTFVPFRFFARPEVTELVLRRPE